MAKDQGIVFTDVETKAIVKALELQKASYERAARNENDDDIARLRLAAAQGCEVLILKIRNLPLPL